MTETLDHLMEGFLKTLIMAELNPSVGVQVRVVSSWPTGDETVTIPRIIVSCKSQDTPEFLLVGLHRIVVEISSIAESTSPVCSDDLEEMNGAVDHVIVFRDNLAAALTQEGVVTHGTVYGGVTQTINFRKNQISRIRRAEIWARLLNAP